MTTELYAHGILPGPPQSRQYNIPQTQFEVNDSTETESSTPASDDPNQQSLTNEPPAQRHNYVGNQISSPDNQIPRPLLVKSRTTGDYGQHIHNQSRRRFLLEEGGPLATRRMSLIDDYGLDELRAPPILPDRERRNSLEQVLARKSIVPPKSLSEHLHDDIIVASWIIFLSIWGDLARVGLSALSIYPGNPVFELIWSQFVGCVVMGFLLQDKILFPKDDRYTALYIGLTTGFCGSLTSFSSFMWNCFCALANLEPYFPRATGRNVLALLAQIIVTLCMSIAALRFGAHCAQLMGHTLPSLRQGGKMSRVLDWMGITLAVGGWAGAAIMTAFIPDWRGVLFTTVFAPAGNGLPWFADRRCVVQMATLPIQPRHPFLSARDICS